VDGDCPSLVLVGMTNAVFGNDRAKSPVSNGLESCGERGSVCGVEAEEGIPIITVYT
jgi:hypothetical protein